MLRKCLRDALRVIAHYSGIKAQLLHLSIFSVAERSLRWLMSSDAMVQVVADSIGSSLESSFK